MRGSRSSAPAQAPPCPLFGVVENAPLVLALKLGMGAIIGSGSAWAAGGKPSVGAGMGAFIVLLPALSDVVTVREDCLEARRRGTAVQVPVGSLVRGRTR